MTLVSLDALVAGARAGKLVIFPTDTVPAIAALPEQAALIFAAKRRSQDKALILMAASADELWSFVTGSDNEYEIWQQVGEKYWPGAITLVLPASAHVPKAVLSIYERDLNQPNMTTIGIRVPNSAIARTILQQTGPLATTSANISGQPPLQTIAELEAQFPDALIAATEYQNEIPGMIPSTVAKWTRKDWQILRQGAVKLE